MKKSERIKSTEESKLKEDSSFTEKWVDFPLSFDHKKAFKEHFVTAIYVWSWDFKNSC